MSYFFIFIVYHQKTVIIFEYVIRALQFLYLSSDKTRLHMFHIVSFY